MTESSPTPRREITQLLHQLADGQEEGAPGRARLFELVYAELHRVAARLMERERAGHTLQPTALVHEAFLRLVDQTSLRPNDREHFLAIAARAMRRILVDHARAVSAGKRGGDWQRVTMATGEDLALVDPASNREIELLDLDVSLERFAALDPRAAQVAEMRLFAGMTLREIADALKISPRSVDDDWATARAWLSREIRGDSPA